MTPAASATGSRHPRRAGSSDYGCGVGDLLVAAREVGWEPVGVEFASEVARDVEERTGVRCVDDGGVDSLPDGTADVVHLGDVIEHLTDPNAELPRVLRLLRPGGALIAQGPLEANPNLFLALLRASKLVRRGRESSLPPYHVTLATLAGQRALFERFGLEPVEMSVFEVSWPAPRRLTRENLSAGSAALFGARKLSQAVSRLAGDRLGNRYFYVGRVPAAG